MRTPSAEVLEELAAALGADELRERSDAWFDALPGLRTLEFDDYRQRVGDWPSSQFVMQLLPAGINVVRALALARALIADPRSAPGLQRLAAYTAATPKGGGVRSIALAAAALRALGNLPGEAGVAALGQLRAKLTRASIRRVIDKELSRAAKRLGIEAAALVERAAADHGLREGVAEHAVGEAVARVKLVAAGKSQLTWRLPSGKTQKSIPAALKSTHADELRQLKAARKRLEADAAAHA